MRGIIAKLFTNGRRPALLSVLPLALLFLLSGCSEQVELRFLPPDSTILAFGDSLTQGVGSTGDGDYPHQLQQLSGRKVINAGISGEVSAEGLLNYSPNTNLPCLFFWRAATIFSATGIKPSLSRIWRR